MKSGEMELNRFASALRDVCREHVLREKWLLAPTRRVGFQWLDRVALSGRPVFHVRVKTLLNMALEIASPVLVSRGAEYLRGAAEEVLIDRAFGRLAGAGGGYLGSLEPGPGLTRVLRASIRDLRVGGVRAAALRAETFEARDKGRDVTVLLREYEKELEAGNLLDYAGLLEAAAERLGSVPGCLPEGVLVLVSREMEAGLAGLERRFWEAVPPSSRRVLDVDRPGRVSNTEAGDAALLGWIREPAAAPPPVKDGTASLFRAVGEVNEVREVFRRCSAAGIPLDQVEVLYTDRETYVPLLYEQAWELGGEDHESLPVTFAEGLPPRYSRPGRALLGWLTWIGEGFPQRVMLWMIRDGLFLLPEAEEAGWSPAGLAEIFRTVPIGEGARRTLRVLNERIQGLQARATVARGGDGAGAGEDRDEVPDRAARERTLRLRLAQLKAVRNLVSDLLLWAPPSGGDAGQKAWLEGTALFLERRVRRVNKFDEYCHEQLVNRIRELADCLGDEEVRGLDVPRWLKDLPLSSRVGGLGPRPGCVHAAPLHLGGHAGRTHTFIVGMDDGRFPGGGLQDPLLLDAERRRVSGDLPTASGRLERKSGDLALLLARLRGHVTLSYSCRNLADDRDVFPSPQMLSAYRILSGNREAVLAEMSRDLPPPVSFSPELPERCLVPSEWWLWRTCQAEPPAEPREALARHFPHLGRGMAARLARESDRFTEYDGFVPEAAADADPARPGGPVLSPSRLELLGACPLDYFFRYVLGVEPPEEVEVDPQVWLDALERGELLHEVFRRYMGRVFPAGEPAAGFRADEALMSEILQEEIKRWQGLKPPGGREAFQREVRDLRQTARIFLLEEERFCRKSTPRYFEVAVGVPPQGDGSPLDTAEPVTVPLPGGAAVRVRGRIDRIDSLPGREDRRFSVWDYKTGSSWKYTTDTRQRNPDPFDQGRVVQNALYLALAEARLREVVSPGAAVDRFGYFFPGTRAHGERISWSAGELADGGEILARLCRMLETGCFPFSDTVNDVRYSPYGAATGDPARTAAESARKMANPENRALEPFRILRGYDETEET